MKKHLLILIVLMVCYSSFSQEPTFQAGEWFKFKMSYSGFFKAGNATLSVTDSEYKGKEVFRVIGKGWTTGAIKWFFKVEDVYESYIDKETYLPHKFIRKINEGGYTKDKEIEFDHVNNKAHVTDKKHDKKMVLDTKINAQDMISTFYYLRHKLDVKNLKEGDEIIVTMFFDEENYPFKLKFLGRETISTSFGNLKTLKFRPSVMSGRVFKEEESLTLWVSDDKNKVPIRVKADLAVGSLRADLESFKGLKYPFRVLVK